MYKFNVALAAKATIKERVVWMLYLGILFFLLYGSANYLASITAPHTSLFFAWERNIPFIESFIVPYMASDLMFILAFLLPYTRLELRVLALRVFTIVVVSVLLFLLIPLQFTFEKPAIESFSFLFTALESDQPFNQAPSLHVSFAIVLWYSMQSQFRSWFVKTILALWFIIIALSTLFVYQHHFIDLPTGAFLGFLVVYSISEKRKNKILKTFMTPRSLKMALYYLVASAIFMLLSFTVSVFFLYLFLSLFLVSVVYAFGLNEMLFSKSLKKYFFKQVLFAPYIWGNYLSWNYYKRNLELMTKVKEKVYFGRLYDNVERQTIEDKGLKHIINLATEHTTLRKHIFHRFYNLPFLDQTIPNPELLHKAVLLIEEHKEEGVYIHCALGLSRSVLVISAWLIYTGDSRDEVEKLMNKIRPSYVKTEYMGIALDIYEDYLA
jgi:protein-tyrosine phosphatase